MLLGAASIALGLLLGVVYVQAATRSQLAFAQHPGVGAGLVFVAELMARFGLVGVVFVGTSRWTSLPLVPLAVAFVGGYTLLHGYVLYRYAVGRGPLDGDGGPGAGRR